MNGAHAQARSSLCSGEMVRQARILAQATSDLVNAIKADAEGETDLEKLPQTPVCCQTPG